MKQGKTSSTLPLVSLRQGEYERHPTWEELDAMLFLMAVFAILTIVGAAIMLVCG